MDLVKAKCTQCGGELDVNPEAECLICKFCGTPFIVSKAINNYNTTVNNTTVNNVVAENVTIGGFNEEDELAKARKLVSKDPGLAAKKYDAIFEHNPDNYEAQYLRIYLNEEKKTVNVKKDSLKYDPILKMNTFQSEYHQEDQDVYSEDEKEDARNELFDKVIENNDTKIKPFLREVFSLKYLTSYRTSYYFIDSVMHFNNIPKGNLEIMLFLYEKEEVVTGIRNEIDFQLRCYKDYGDRHYADAVEKLEAMLITIDPSYVKVELPKSAKSSGGCYVATCVYGSYDCPEVWVLRRFRDYRLNKTWFGRAFIKTYYAISPTLVKWFGGTKWFKAMWRGKLDHMVEKYKAEGFEDTPYNDLY